MNKQIHGLLHREYTLPKSQTVAFILQKFSPFERGMFLVLLFVFVLSAFFLASSVNTRALVTVPSFGGSFSEGVIGSPRFINPLLAQSDADRDLSALIYSGLMRATPEGGLRYDLAEGHTVSEDGLTYTFKIRDDAVFQDGEEVTADDVIFTVKKVQDASLKSPKRASWEGVSVEKVNDKEVVFNLERPYTPFLENLTLGILPEHIWKNAAPEEFTFSQFNIEPVGTGPYKVKKIERNSSGIPEYYELEAFDDYTLGQPHIKTIRIHFYSNENFLIDAYINGDIDAINSVTPNNLAYAELNTDNVRVERVPLPRIFGVFFNQNQAPIFTHIEVRAALQAALDKQKIVDKVLDGYGTVIDSPIPPGILPIVAESSAASSSEDVSISRKKKAIDILERNGWTVNKDDGVWEKKTKQGTERLEFSISTSNTPELKEAAELIRQQWDDIGAKVTVKVFETGDLNQNVIRPRKYDALLFGEIVGRDLDLFPFWHSSQRNDPGLNIALYANITVDKLLEEARTISDRDERIEKFIEFNNELQNDIPAVFLYAPDFIYVAPNKVDGIRLGTITTPSERFLNVYEWYINTDSVWSFFVK